MPQIPRYFSQVVIQPNETPKIPVGLGGMVGEATARVGDIGADIGYKLDQKLDQLRQLEEFTKHSIDASQKIHALYSDTINSDDFITDPKTAKNTFNTQVDALGKQYIQQITDPEIRIKFQDHFSREAIARKYDVEDAARKQSIDSGRATTERSLIALKDLASKAKTKEDFDYQVGRGVGLLRAGGSVGLYKLEDVAKQEQKFISSAIVEKAKMHIYEDAEGAFEQLSKGQGIYAGMLDEDKRPLLELSQRRSEQIKKEDEVRLNKAKVEAEQKELNGALKEMQTMYPGNPQAQADFVANTQNYPNMDVQKRSTLQSMISGEGERKRRETEAAQKQNDNAFIRDFHKTGKTDADIKAADISPELIGTLIDKNRQIAERNDKTDPKILSRTLSMVYNREITDMAQVAKIPGIGVDAWPEIEKSIEQATDPSQSGYYKKAADLFKAKMGKDSGEEPDFLMMLDHHIKNDNLKGPEIYKRAQEMLQVIEDGWINDRYQYQKELEAAPWLDLPERESFQDWSGMVEDEPHREPGPNLTGATQKGSVPTQNAEPTNPGPVDLGMPAPLRGRFVGMLQENKLPVTDANLLHLYEQYKAQGGE